MSGLPAPDPGRRRPRAAGRALLLPGETLDDMPPLVGVPLPGRLRVAPRRRGIRHLAADDLGAAVPPPPRVGPPVYGQLAVGATAIGWPTSRPSRRRGCARPISIRGFASPRASAPKSSGRTRTATSKRRGGRWATVLGANNLRRRAEFSLAASASLHRNGCCGSRPPISSPSTAPVHARVFVGENLTITGRLRDSPLPPRSFRSNTAGSRARAATCRVRRRWRASVGPAVLASRSPDAQPMYTVVSRSTRSTRSMPTSRRLGNRRARRHSRSGSCRGRDQTGLTAAAGRGPARFADPARQQTFSPPTGRHRSRLVRPVGEREASRSRQPGRSPPGADAVTADRLPAPHPWSRGRSITAVRKRCTGSFPPRNRPQRSRSQITAVARVQLTDVAKVIIDRQIVDRTRPRCRRRAWPGAVSTRLRADRRRARSGRHDGAHGQPPDLGADATAGRGLDDIMARPICPSRPTRRWPRSRTTGCCRASIRFPRTRRRWSSRTCRSSAGFSSA